MVDLRAEVDSASNAQAKVLILGETGSGKEAVARLIHGNGARRQGRFVTVNCSGVPETLLESELFGHTRGSFTGAFRDKAGLAQVADGGTLFLDECGEMSLRMQAVLLRFLETGEVQPIGATTTSRVDVRLIAATNRDLKARIATQEFREDLYYRLNVIQIVVPPLRDRRSDIVLLMEHFLDRASELNKLSPPRLTPAASEALVRYGWPGNVRELKNVAERLVVRHAGRQILMSDLPLEIQNAATQGAPSGLGHAAAPSSAAMSTVDQLWQRLMNGESFWVGAHPMFRSHDLTRNELRELVRRGLEHTQGNYRQLVQAFNMDLGDYRRFLSFLYQHDCNLPFQNHRSRPLKASLEGGQRTAAAGSADARER